MLFESFSSKSPLIYGDFSLQVTYNTIPLGVVSQDVLNEKYIKNGETTIEQIFDRVAKQMASVEKPEDQERVEKMFRKNMELGAIGAGRIMSSGGTDIKATLINCFVQPVGDSIRGYDKDGNPGIYTALELAAETMRMGGGVGYNFSKIRPHGAWIQSTMSMASGPCSYMNVFDASCTTVESLGCFTGDTLIHTTQGLIPIKQIVDSEDRFYAITHLGPKLVTTKFRNGVKPVWEVTTNYGYKVRVTPDHKFAQFENGKIVTKAIKDIVKSNDKSLLVLIPTVDVTAGEAWTNEEAEAYLVGAFHGNGSWVRGEDRNSVRGFSLTTGTSKMPVINKTMSLLIQLGLNPKFKFRRDEKAAEIACYDTEFFRGWKEKGVDKGDMHIPSFILQAGTAVRAAYIAGLMDADGTVSETKSNIRLRMISKPLLEEVQVVLASLGVPTTLKLEREAQGVWKEIYCLGIYGPVAQDRYAKTAGKFSVQTLANLATRERVGFGHKALELLEFGYTKSNFAKHWSGSLVKHPKISLNALIHNESDMQFTNTVSDEILDVVILDDEETYDLEVQDVHLLAGNGIYTSNSRRGAQMGMLNDDHPDVLTFIKAKNEKGRWNNFNVSVAVTDKFMRAVENDEDWVLVHKAKPHPDFIADPQQNEDGLWIYKTIKARVMWDEIMENTYDHAEPGIIFVDRVNANNPLYYTEKIDCTNPCGEQPLPAYGCCDLGPIILPYLVENPFGKDGVPSFNFDKLAEAVKVQVRFLDNVLDATHWPLKEQQAEAMAKRRIGIGFTGLGNALAMLKVKYNSQEGLEVARAISIVMRDAAYEASSDLALEKGSFPLFDAEKYLAGEFVSALPERIKEKIRVQGIRNSHTLSIAPTGTVSLAFGNNTSNGIEPPFSYGYTRTKRMADGTKMDYDVEDFSYRLFKELFGKDEPLPDYFVTALEMTAEDHMKMMEYVQPFIDSAISKTVNVPGDYPFEDFKDLYMQAWKAKLKGIATYRPNSTLGSVLTVKEEPKPEVKVEVKEVEADESDLNNQLIDKRPKGFLPGLIEKVEYVAEGQKCRFYLTIGFLTLTEGDKQVQRPIEFFLKNLEGEHDDQWIEATMRVLSLSARGGQLSKALRDMKKVQWNKGPVRLGFTQHVDGYQVPKFHPSLTAAVAYAIENLIAKFENTITPSTLDSVQEEPKMSPVTNTAMNGRKCPECGAHAMVKRDGCEICTNCGLMGSCG